jgi:hypothetical protein
MMVRSTEDGRWTATFSPRKRVKFSGTGFLALWLCVWAAGEAFALGILLASLAAPGGARFLRLLETIGAAIAPGLAERLAWRAVPGPEAGTLALSFIASWLAIWTLAGAMAIYQVARLLASEDRVAWDGAGVEIFRRLGPFRTRRRWSAEQIEHVSLSRPDRALLLHTPRATYALTEWGTRAERAEVRDEIRSVLGSTARAAAEAGEAEVPRGWVASPEADGGTLLVRDPAARRGRAAAAWGGTMVLAAGAALAWTRELLDGPRALGAFLALCACAAGSVWASLGGTRFVVREGEIEFRPARITGRSSVTLREARLSVEHTTDDDGDDWFELQVRSGDERRTIDRRMNESERVLQLARWIAAHSGAPLDLGRGVEDAGDDRHSLAA